MTIRSIMMAAFAASTLWVGAAGAADITVPRTVSTDTTWTKDNTYILEGYTFVTNNATLTIQPGTVIKGRQTTGANAAALIITRGAKIMAEGTATEPIIFTSELDNLAGNLGPDDTALWGGVLVLGNARINSRANGEPAGTPAQDQIEGVSVQGSEIDYITFGGTNDEDNSGVLRYVSIRHGGAVIGTDNEINGLTLGGVGSGTTIDYIEVFANKDDGIEFFGGTVNARHIVLGFGNDDGLDFDQGYRGNVQFVFNLQSDIGTDRGDKGVEWDGATSPLDAAPKAVVTIANATMIGIGPSGGNNTAINIRDNVEARLYNSIFVNYAKGLDIENDVGTPVPDIKNNLWWSHVEANNSASGLNARPDSTVNISAYWSESANNNTIVNPQLRSISYEANGQLDPRPATGSPALVGDVQTLSGSGLEQTTYKGAFGATNWALGWTKLWEDGYFAESDGGGGDGEITILPGTNAKPVNLATRGQVGTGANILIGGLFIAGTEQQTILVRAVGPTLAQAPYNLTGVLADPIVSIFNSAGEKVAENDNWGGGAALADVFSRVGAAPLPGDSLDAALVTNVSPGAYTVQVSGANNATGVALVEIFEVDE